MNVHESEWKQDGERDQSDGVLHRKPLEKVNAAWRVSRSGVCEGVELSGARVGRAEAPNVRLHARSLPKGERIYSEATLCGEAVTYRTQRQYMP